MRVQLAVLNLRMGGQWSSIVSLCHLLRDQGVDAEVALPAGVASASKVDIAAFARLPLLQRAGAMLRMLRELGRGDPAPDVVHLVLPTPAFAPIARLLRAAPARVLLQYEGAPTHLDAAHLCAAFDDPRLMLPRLLLNHAIWARAAVSQESAHLATFPALSAWLRATGFRRVFEVANVAVLDDEAASGPLRITPNTCTVAYVGHCHPIKGVFDLLSAFLLVAERRPDLRLLLALTDDGDRPALARRVQALPPALRSRIDLAGLVPMRALLATVDALALPYRAITTTTVYPSLLLEAEAMACPVLLADLPEFENILDRSSDRLHLVPPADCAALAAVLARLPKRASHSGRPALTLPDNATRVRQLRCVYDTLKSEVP